MIKIGIVGCGNLGRAAAALLPQSTDMTLTAIFSRRKIPGCLPFSEIAQWKGKLDVLLLCGGSASDLPAQSAALARDFCIVDSFDNHSQIPTHFQKVDKAAKEGATVALISAGWDPGLFSLFRLYGGAVLPRGKHYTFWGPGVSQGHSDALRRIEGVADARQYTLPQEVTLSEALTPFQMHRRHCYVVAKAGADKEKIQQTIRQMPGYFAPYDTTVEFVTQAQLDRDHSGLPHGGRVICTDTESTMEYRLQLLSNPQFTAGVLLCCARAVSRLYRRGETGCKTFLDIAPVDLTATGREELLKQLL